MISIRMLKLCRRSICKPPFQSFMKQGKFPLEWKKANGAPVHKKGDKADFKKLSTCFFTSHFWKKFQ